MWYHHNLYSRYQSKLKNSFFQKIEIWFFIHFILKSIIILLTQTYLLFTFKTMSLLIWLFNNMFISTALLIMRKKIAIQSMSKMLILLYICCWLNQSFKCSKLDYLTALLYIMNSISQMLLLWLLWWRLVQICNMITEEQ